MTWREILTESLQALRYRPVLCLSLACLAGITWADWATPPPLTMFCLLCLGLTLSAGLVFSPSRRLLSVSLLMTVLVLGATLHAWRLTPAADDFFHLAGQVLPSVEGTVSEVIWQAENCQMIVLAARTPQEEPGRGLLLALVPGDVSLQIGDRVALHQVHVSALRPPGTPGEYSLSVPRRRQGLHAEGQAEGMELLAKGPAWRASSAEWVASVRARLLRTLTQAMPGSEKEQWATLLAGMVYGMKAAPVSEEMTELFRRSGTIHLLVASGAQVSAIAFILIFLLRGGRRAFPWWAALAVLSALGLLTAIVGPGPSIWRSVALATLLLLSYLVGRQYDFPTSLAASALLLCLADTSILFDVGFQLTYVCSLGLYLAAPTVFRDRWGLRKNLVLMTALRGTAGVWLVSAPFLAYHFHNVVVVGVLANVVAVPLSVAILYLGLSGLIVGQLWVFLATPFCLIARILLQVIVLSNTLFASLPGAVITNLAPSVGEAALWLALALLVLGVARTPAARHRLLIEDRGWVIAGTVLVVGILLLALDWQQTRPRPLRMHVLDVGAGQCLLIEGPTGRRVLVDAGTQVFGQKPEDLLDFRILPYFAKIGVHRLDTVIISHAHEDHCNLLAGLLKSIPARQVLVGPQIETSEDWVRLTQALTALRLTPLTVQAGANIDLGGGASIQVLEPITLQPYTDDDANNNSLVLRLNYGQLSVLLPADLQKPGERRLLCDYGTRLEALQSTVLMAGHHGSVTSGSGAFVNVIAPQLVLISCGRGRRAPRPKGLAPYQNRGLPIWRTDLNGTLLLTTDGRRLQVRGYRQALSW